LDFTAAATVLGKPFLVDMDLGLSTAPMLYAAQELPHLRPMVMRRFKEKGDKQKATLQERDGHGQGQGPGQVSRTKSRGCAIATPAVGMARCLIPTDTRCDYPKEVSCSVTDNIVRATVRECV
jgi:hypothetical protein